MSVVAVPGIGPLFIHLKNKKLILVLNKLDAMTNFLSFLITIWFFVVLGFLNHYEHMRAELYNYRLQHDDAYKCRDTEGCGPFCGHTCGRKRKPNDRSLIMLIAFTVGTILFMAALLIY